MNKSFYGSLAVSNIKKNARSYIPYMLTCIVCIMIFYIMMAIVYNPDVTKMLGGPTLKSLLAFGAWIVGFFSAIFLFYTNSFLIKQRKKELALYNILGMAKRHVGKMFFLETVITSVISLAVGILGGAILGKLVFLVLLKIMQVDIPMGYEFSLDALVITLLVFGVIFFIVLLCNLGRISLSDPIQLMAGSRQGEKEPKTKWLLTIAGFILTGIGYYIAITVKSPLEALMAFFIAVLLVIAGTYLLFITGSIAILKLMRKNKKFYYKTQHFTSISGMLYRMKRNAAGLASICILSTMVLVTVSTTVSLQVGLDDIVKRNMPDHIRIDNAYQITAQQQQQLKKQAEDILTKHGVQVESSRSYQYTSSLAVAENGELLPTAQTNMSEETSDVYFIPLKECSEASKYEPLAEDEVIISSHKKIDSEVIKIAGKDFKVKDGNSDFVGVPSMGTVSTSYYVLVADQKVQDEINRRAGDDILSYGGYIGININENDWDKVKAAVKELEEKFPDATKIRDYQTVRTDFHAIYGGLLFVGLFLGLLFLVATVLIIYYKQITEGYEDSERYQIMQKVGMSRTEVKHSIRSQILLVFFLPLAVAVIHVAAAFNMMSKLLTAMNLSNVGLFAVTTAITILVFIVFYIIVYSMTAREYYKLVK